MPEQRDDITAAMHDVQDLYHVVRHDAVDDDVIVGRKAAQAKPQIFVTATAHVRIPGQRPETLGDAFHHAGGNLGAAALAGDVNPDVVKLGFRLRRKTELAHQRRFCASASRAMPRRVTSAASWVTS
jgi:hypothetical protein